MYRETKLKELLKTGRAKCLFDSGVLYLTKGKSYNVWGGYDSGNILVIDDSNMVVPYPLSYFEPVCGVHTKVSFNTNFKVGDKVYKFGETDVKTVLEVFENGYMRISNYPYRVNHETLCHATQENCERLQATFPDIEFEHPPTQEDIDNEAVDKLAQAMKNKLAKKREQGYHGWETCKHGDLVQLLINHVDKGDPIDVANFCAFLFARGEQLTQGGTR